MPEGQVLEFTHVTKRFSEVTAISDFSARIEPGAVTAFLGPNGAGKTTTLRILLGQLRATSGTATIGGTPYAELRQPLRTIGAVLEETPYRPRRTANRQLAIAAKANGIPLSRIDEVLALVGLDGEGDTRIGGYSLGMRQRLSVAHALLGDPGALVFDEPANGLDPEGIRWMRLLMRRLADEGRTVLVSSHVLSEVEQVADSVLVLSKGQLVLSSGIEELADPAGGAVVVDADDRAALRTALASAGLEIEVLRSGLTVRGADAATVGAAAARAGVALSTLVQRGPTLEDVFIELVRGGRLEPRAEAVASQLVAPAPEAETAVEAGAAAEADAAPATTANPAVEAETPDADPLSAAETRSESESGQEAPAAAVDAAGAFAPVAADPHTGAPVAVGAAESAADVETGAAEGETPAADASSDAAEAEPTSHDTAAVASDAPSEESDAASEAEAEDDALTVLPPAGARSFDDILFGSGNSTDAEAEEEDIVIAPLSTSTTEGGQTGLLAEAVAAHVSEEQSADEPTSDEPTSDEHSSSEQGTDEHSSEEQSLVEETPEAEGSTETVPFEGSASADDSTSGDSAEIAPANDDSDGSSEADTDARTATEQTEEHPSDEQGDDQAGGENDIRSEEPLPTESGDDSADESDRDDHQGVEFFAELEGESAPEDSPAEAADAAEPDAEGDVQADAEASDDDPRSAAVSSMIAAAARAYYEDEPKDYPFGGQGEQQPEASDERPTWAVASTGVIDTIPGAEPSAHEASDETPVEQSDAPSDEERAEPEHSEHRDDAQHDGDEHHGHSEHHGDENHDGSENREHGDSEGHEHSDDHGHPHDGHHEHGHHHD